MFHICFKYNPFKNTEINVFLIGYVWQVGYYGQVEIGKTNKKIKLWQYTVYFDGKRLKRRSKGACGVSVCVYVCLVYNDNGGSHEDINTHKNYRLQGRNNHRSLKNIHMSLGWGKKRQKSQQWNPNHSSRRWSRTCIPLLVAFSCFLHRFKHMFIYITFA